MRKLGKEDYINHLISINERLILFHNLVINGQKALVEDLALKIRILYMRKSGTEPLFQTIQNLFDFKINVWVRETFEEQLKRKGLEHLINTESIGYSNEIDYWLEKGDYKLEIIEAFNRPKILKIGQHIYSAKEIVEIVADQLGGAHIDSKLNERSLTPQSSTISFGIFNTSEHFILKTTKQTIEINKLILEYVLNNNQSEFIVKN